MNIQAADLERQHFRLETRALTFRTGNLRHVAFHFLPLTVRERVAMAAFHHGNDTFKRSIIALDFAAHIFITETEFFRRAVAQIALALRRQVTVRIIQRQTVRFQERHELHHEP